MLTRTTNGLGVINRVNIIYLFITGSSKTLQWRHNWRDSVSNHQPRDCLLNRLFRRRSKKHQNSASLAFVWGIHRWPVNSPHKWPVTRKMFPFDDVMMKWGNCWEWIWIIAISSIRGWAWSSSSGNIFRVTGLLWGESIDHMNKYLKTKFILRGDDNYEWK